MNTIGLNIDNKAKSYITGQSSINYVKFNMKALLQKLDMIAEVLSPYIDREIEEVKNRVSDGDKRLKSAIDELKVIRDKITKLQYLKEKVEKQIQILDTINDLLNSINIGKQTKDKIIEDLKNLKNMSVDMLDMKYQKYVNIRNKYFEAL